MTAIAAQAGVAPATVYQAFGNKVALLARALDQAIVDDHESSGLLERPWLDGVRLLADPRDRLVEVVRHTSAVAARTAPLKRAMRDAAAADPELRALIELDHARRLATQTELVGVILGDSPPRPGLTREEAVATYFGVVNSEGYLVMAGSLGWDLPRWQRWLVDLLAHELLGDAPGGATG